MLAKYWKKIGLIIVIVACLFNVMIKLINKLSFDKEMLSSAQYMQDQSDKDNKDDKDSKDSKNTENNTKNNKKMK